MNDIQKARILWRCRRGMLELDLLLQTFIQHKFECLKPSELTTLERLLDSTDPELYSLLMGHTKPQCKDYLYLVTHIQSCQV